MPFISNSTTGTVTYSPGVTNHSLILPNDTANNNSATLVEVSEFEIPVAKYERYVVKYHLFTTHNATADLKVKVDVPASPTIYRAQLVSGGDEGTTTLTSEADLELTTDTANDIVEVKFLIHNGANAGEIKFSFAERDASGGGVIILGGSYAEYSRF